MICFKNFSITHKICLELPERSPKNIKLIRRFWRFSELLIIKYYSMAINFAKNLPVQ